MLQWWARNEKYIPKNHTDSDVKSFKSKIDDLTGCIPLLLKECVLNGTIDLSADALRDTATQVVTFIRRLKDEVTAGSWNT